MEHLEHVVKDFAICFEMQIMEINGACSDKLPESFIVFIFLDTKLYLEGEALYLKVSEIEHLNLAELESTSEVTLDMSIFDLHDGAGFLFALDNLKASLLDLKSL